MVTDKSGLNGTPAFRVLTTFVMPGHSRLKNGVAAARLCPGHPRLDERSVRKDVDGRNKSGHDDKQEVPVDKAQTKSAAYGRSTSNTLPS